MRDILRKAATASIIAGAALAVAACGGNKATNTTNTATLPVDTYNSTDTMGSNMMMDNTSMMSDTMNAGAPVMMNESNHSGAAAH